MRIARLAILGRPDPIFARVEEDGYVPLLRAPWHSLEVDPCGRIDAPAKLLTPVMPTKIVCIGRNYREHAKELGHEVPVTPHIFMKPVSALLGPGESIVRPVHMSRLVHHEGELAVVIGGPLRHVARPEEALLAVLGYTCANDVTARDLQREDKHFTRAKGFDTFCPMGPVIVTSDEVLDPQSLTITTTVNGAVRQRGSTADMVFGIGPLLAYVSQIMTLVPGDVVLTGTPAGVGELVAGDSVSVEISSIGVLTSSVVDGSPL